MNRADLVRAGNARADRSKLRDRMPEILVSRRAVGLLSYRDDDGRIVVVGLSTPSVNRLLALTFERRAS